MPVKATTCGLDLSLSLILRLAERLPVADGVNVMLTVQLAPETSFVPQVLVVSAKSAAFLPVIARLLICSAAAPGL